MNKSSTIVFILVLLGMNAYVTIAKDPVAQEVQEAFKKWKEGRNRLYSNGKEEDNRLRIFEENYNKIKKMQSEDRPYQVELNKFADMSTEEFATAYLGTRPSNVRAATTTDPTILQATTSTVPATIDWRAKNAVTPIKNQGYCGSCWSFSAVGAMEGLYAIKYGLLKTFSEQQLIDCSGSYGTYACNGGVMTAAFKYTRDYGVELGTVYPYTGTKGTCKFDKTKVVFKNIGWVSVTANNNVQLAAAVATRPVSAAVQADASVFQFYKGGIIDGTACGTSLNHGILIVGYGSENGKDFWIIKNSWGTSWGEGGYVRIAKSNSTSSAGVCGIAMMASYPTA
jgi:C1A family cysteine protease